MARTILERGRPRADWTKDAAIVRTYRDWGIAHGLKPVTIDNGRAAMRNFHDFLVREHGRDYYRPEHGVENVGWEDGRKYRELLIAMAQSGQIGGGTARNKWFYVRNFFSWRAESDPKNAKYVTDAQKVKLFWTIGKVVSVEKTGWEPYAIEDVHKIVKAARSITVLVHGENAEDYYVVMMLLYSGQRAQIYGLRWDQIDFDENVIRTKAKMGARWELPLVPPLREALLELRGKSDGRRMVFAYGSYPYWDGEPAKGRCAYDSGRERCEETVALRLYHERDGDVPYCGAHLTRILQLASKRNNDNVHKIVKRVEAALHKSYPDLIEKTVDPRTNTTSTRPVHIHAHRFRKTLATNYRRLGVTKEQVAKVFGWKDADVVEDTYNLPGMDNKHEIAGSIDLVKASEAAERGDFDSMRPKTELERLRVENEALRAQIGALTDKIGTLSGQLTELLLRLPKNGGAP